MNTEKRPTLDELLEELDDPLYGIDWKSGDVQPELLADVDPDEIGWDWDVTDEKNDVPDED
ncbi:hypothetical protein RRM51_001035 [Aeromonas veronii]|uniref:hypothetical protein n=1 Tax=Aeromonas veronii TaxID=654 RepID=UPI0014313E0D|nr:hypothetical protein [Aeromonas veronii]ELI6421655.1 hypothetical protein [Aeromonas veronii]NJI26814.1 hypothetical protein [Aeromonas veronii]